MATGRQVQLTKQVGEYLVAAELSRRGLLTATFAGNVPDYDIVATGGRGQTALVQVKAIAGPSWQFDIRTFVDVRYTAGAQTMGQPTTPPAGPAGSVIVTSPSESGSTVISHRSWRPSTRRAPVTSPPLTVNASSRSVV